MMERFRNYFRSGHVSMTPCMTPGMVLSGFAYRVRRSKPAASVFPWRVWAQQQPPVGSADTNASSDKKMAVHGIDTYNGSGAIAAALTDAGLVEKDAVLLPAYCCGAELGPFRQIGCKILFYDVHQDLSINREQIEHCVQQNANIRLLFITHYFGMPQPETRALLTWCENQDIILLEDCAHALYSEDNGVPLGMVGHYAIFSPRKSLPVTEGGRLVARRPLTAEGLLRPRRAVAMLPRLSRLCYSVQQGVRSRLPGSKLKSVFAVAVLAFTTLPSIFIKVARRAGNVPESDWLTPDVEGELAVPMYDVGISRRTHYTFANSHGQQIVETRRRNFYQWLSSIENCKQVTPLITSLAEGSCPLYFPVEVDNPAACVSALADADIEAFNWWQHTPPELARENATDFPVAKGLKRSIVALPVHQLVTPQQVERMAECLKKACCHVGAAGAS